MKKIIISLFFTFLLFTIKGQSVTISPNGSLKINSGSQGDGKVLTSDANGNTSWQALNLSGTPAVHLSANAFTQTNIPSGNVTKLTTWNNIDQEGGNSYNAATGEYTIPVNGYYSVMCHLNWATAPTSGGESAVVIYLNNNQIAWGFSNRVAANIFPSDPHVHIERRFVAGDVIHFSAFQNSLGNMQLSGGGLNNRFAIHLIHR